MKLVQKIFLKGIREFEIAGDTVNVRVKTRLKEEKLTVVLSVVNPDPVVNGSFLDFYSRVKADDVLFSLYLDKPDADAFNAFVGALRRRAREAYHAFTGLRDGMPAEDVAANLHDAPVDFDEAIERPGNRPIKPANPASIETAIRMLEQYLDVEEIEPMLVALQALKAQPDNPSRFDQLAIAFAGMGSRQGAVLTYAPYVGILLADT